MISEALMDELQALVLTVLGSKEALERALARAFDDVVRKYDLTGLHVTEGEHVIDAVWWETGRAPVVRDVLGELRDRELLGPAWFDELRRAAPGRADEIDALQARIAAAVAAGKGAPIPPPDEPQKPVPWALIAGVGGVVLVGVVVLAVGAGSGWFSPRSAGRDTGARPPRDIAERLPPPIDVEPHTDGQLPPDAEEVITGFDTAWVVALTRTCGSETLELAGLAADTEAIATIVRPSPGGASCTWRDDEGAGWEPAATADGVVVLRPVAAAPSLLLQPISIPPGSIPPGSVQPRTLLPGSRTLDAQPMRRIGDQPPLSTGTRTKTKIDPRDLVIRDFDRREFTFSRITADELDLKLRSRDVALVRDNTVFRGSTQQIKRALVVSNRPVFEVLPPSSDRRLTTRVGTTEVVLKRQGDKLGLPGGGNCDGAPVLTPGKTVAGLCRMKAGGVQVVPVGAEKVASVLQSLNVVVFLVQ